MQLRTVATTAARAATLCCAALVATLSACQGAAPAEPTAASTGSATAPTAAAAVGAPPDGAASACAAGQLPTLAAGRLTLGTDNPAYSPYWLPREGGNRPPWDSEFSGDPSSGTGFEGAVARTLAERLGYAPEATDWVAVKFDNSYAPGPKPFDVYLAQVSYTPERAQAADLSDGYYSLNQALVALADSPVATAKTLGGLKAYRFGAQAGTTSYDTIAERIAPEQETRVYDSNDAAIQALSNTQIDGLVVDLPTAFYITSAQLEGSVIVGQFAPRDGEPEHFSMVLAKGSPLTPCVNAALATMKADGSLAAITQEWLADKADAPVIQP
ncbi:MAG: amino acid ABC transporter substrate-binding protein [Ardenticatenia bacterium]|nr:amino acid ABC transporter substrate-binding protein [Ardenticatenia bacterium]